MAHARTEDRTGAVSRDRPPDPCRSDRYTAPYGWRTSYRVETSFSSLSATADRHAAESSSFCYERASLWALARRTVTRIPMLGMTGVARVYSCAPRASVRSRRSLRLVGRLQEQGGRLPDHVREVVLPETTGVLVQIRADRGARSRRFD